MDFDEELSSSHLATHLGSVCLFISESVYVNGFKIKGEFFLGYKYDVCFCISSNITQKC